MSPTRRQPPPVRIHEDNYSNISNAPPPTLFQPNPLYGAMNRPYIAGVAATGLPLHHPLSHPFLNPINRHVQGPVNQPLNRPVNRQLYPPVNRHVQFSTNRQVSPPANRPSIRPSNRPANPQASRRVDRPVNHPANSPVNRPLGRPLDRPINHPLSQITRLAKFPRAVFGDRFNVSIPPPQVSQPVTDSLPKAPVYARFHPLAAQKPHQALFDGLRAVRPVEKENTCDNFAEFPEPSRVTEAKPVEEVGNLPAINDDGTKPPYSYATLIGMAILRAPDRRLTLASIYKWISNTCSYYRVSEAGWQNSIRHNLSLNKAFVKKERAKNDPGKGSYWTVEPGMESQFLKDKPTRRGTASHQPVMSSIITKAKITEPEEISSDATIPASDPDEPAEETAPRIRGRTHPPLHSPGSPKIGQKVAEESHYNNHSHAPLHSPITPLRLQIVAQKGLYRGQTHSPLYSPGLPMPDQKVTEKAHSHGQIHSSLNSPITTPNERVEDQPRSRKRKSPPIHDIHSSPPMPPTKIRREGLNSPVTRHIDPLLARVMVMPPLVSPDKRPLDHPSLLPTPAEVAPKEKGPRKRNMPPQKPLPPISTCAERVKDRTYSRKRKSPPTQEVSSLPPPPPATKIRRESPQHDRAEDAIARIRAASGRPKASRGRAPCMPPPPPSPLAIGAPPPPSPSSSPAVLDLDRYSVWSPWTPGFMKGVPKLSASPAERFGTPLGLDAPGRSPFKRARLGLERMEDVAGGPPGNILHTIQGWPDRSPVAWPPLW